ncbi:MAG: GlsB/YeaQ/YmgE family stress response membrane protein [Dermatophilaceae bacterium]|jgi:uncharacterized membrane protein YeaQ/YmgE (transglycosylase-associated protein family)|nr:GlsB/YeaQ/YmgE family stress response membrane protein [Actinomycetales bacterium]MBP8881942.1 GlsB/YeaQ/YmgE family stress response membrane protein [Dermatophilaceae bacterium]MBP9919566.1 GlsB/YeaQ/YmgE family stress response membrane protein [Dermatophilaceae bacterium]
MSFGTIIGMIIIGAIAGFIARALVRGDGVSGILPTIALGIIGSFVGGFLGYLLFNKDAAAGMLQPSGLIGSIIGSVIALLVYRQFNGRRISA